MSSTITAETGKLLMTEREPFFYATCLLVQLESGRRVRLWVSDLDMVQTPFSHSWAWSQMVMRTEFQVQTDPTTGMVLKASWDFSESLPLLVQDPRERLFR
jgi:hypothetical protein